MMSSSHSPPCEIQSDRSITMFSKNTTRVFRRRRREKKVSVASEETEREKETFERRRGNFSLDVLLQRAGRGKNSIPQTSFENWKTKRKRKKLLSFSMQSSSTRKSRRRLQSEKREREREKKSIIVIGCVPPKKGPDHPVFLLARGRVGKACLSVQSLFFEYSMSASKVCCKFR